MGKEKPGAQSSQPKIDRYATPRRRGLEAQQNGRLTAELPDPLPRAAKFSSHADEFPALITKTETGGLRAHNEANGDPENNWGTQTE